MPYVERNAGKVIGEYGTLQPGRATEWLDEGNAELTAFRNPPPTPEDTTRATIQTALRNALAPNRTYFNLANPTAAQTATQAKALSRQNNNIIRLLNNILDGTE